LHPNAGARLRSEVQLLPSHLFPSVNSGYDYVADPPVNQVPGENCVSQGIHDDADGAGAELKMVAPTTSASRLCPPDKSSARTPSARDQYVSCAPVFDDMWQTPLPCPGSEVCAEPASSHSAYMRQMSPPASGSEDRTNPAPTRNKKNSPGRAASTRSSRGDNIAIAPEVVMPLGSSVPSPGSSAPSESETTPAPSESETTPSARPHTWLQGGIRQPKVYTDGTIRYGCLAVTGEPRNLEEALRDKNWKHAMDAEYDALMNNKTWHLVPPQKGRNVIDCKWVYKIKRKADGSLDRYKARLVTKDFKQRYGIDYDRSGVPDLSVRWIISIGGGGDSRDPTTNE
jgi:hypothetical protein